MKDFILWVYWYPFRTCVQILPVALVKPLARMVGKVLYLSCGKRRQAYITECEELFNTGLQQTELDRIVRKAFQNLAFNELEMLLFPKLNPENITRFVEIDGKENLDNALAYGNGAMLAFGHFGANQMIMPAIGYNGYAMSQLSAPATVWQDVLTDRTFSSMERKAFELRWEHEKSLPVTHINVFGSLKKAFKSLRENEVLGVAIDGGGGQDMRVMHFLGHKALFSTGVMNLASRTGCKVLPTFMLRGKNGRTRLIIEPAIEVANGDREATMVHMMETILQRFEEYVRKYPDHYVDFLSLRRKMALRGDRSFILERKKEVI